MIEDSDVADVFGSMMSNRSDGSSESQVRVTNASNTTESKGESSVTDYEVGDDKTTTEPGTKMIAFQFIEKPNGEIGNNGGLIWDREAVLRSAQQIYQRHDFKNEKDKGDFLRFVCQAFGFATNNITDITQIEEIQQADPNEPMLKITVKDDESRERLNAVRNTKKLRDHETEDEAAE